MSDVEQAVALTGRARVLFTDREHGNLSSAAGREQERGAAARERVRESIGVRRLTRGFQVHGTVVQRVRAVEQAQDAPTAAHTADGQATALSELGAIVLSADCLPVALGCEDAVAMVHAGWRGLAAGVLEEGVQAMRELSAGSEIVAVVGPGAGVCCYEVGPEVHRAFGTARTQAHPIDLRAIAHERLTAAGVGEVRDVAACTICDTRFFSHRREGEQAGRQAGVAWLS